MGSSATPHRPLSANPSLFYEHEFGFLDELGSSVDVDVSQSWLHDDGHHQDVRSADNVAVQARTHHPLLN